MILTDTAQEKRFREGKPIRVGVIGAGEMGMGIINQITRFSPGIVVVGIFNRTISKALDVATIAGISRFKEVNTVSEYEEAVSKGYTAITNNVDLLIEGEGAELLIEVTGTIEFATRVTLKAFEFKKHVLSFNAELDATLGPLINVRSKEQGVLYSVADGDQPGVTMNLYRYVKGLGFEPLVCGNIKGMQDHYRTPATQAAFASQWGMNPLMASRFADGTKISFEQACIANATNMKVAVRGMYGFESGEHVDNLTQLFDIEQLKELGGIVDYIVGAKPGPGIFVYATTDDPVAVKYLKYGKLGEGPLYSFYLPYHLLFFDISSSIVRLIDFNDRVIAPAAGPVVEVVATAKTDLMPGDILDDMGGFMAYGQCENSSVARKDNLLPMGIADGLVLKNQVSKDQFITLNDVEIPDDHYLFGLFNEQLAMFK